MSFETYTSHDPQWAELMTHLPHDVYHLPSWARVCETHEAWETRLAVVRRDSDALAMPYMLRNLPRELSGAFGLRDVTSPYGYPGPVCSSSDPMVQASLFAEMLDGFAAIGAVTAFVRFHAHVGLGHETLSGLGDIVVHGHQVWVDLPNLPESTVSSFRAGHRRDIRLLQEAGFSIRIDADDDWGSFVAEYYATMRRLSSDGYYYFPQAYFEAVRYLLADNVHLVAAVAPSGEPAAMAMVLVCGEMAQYHLAGTNDAYLKVAASKLAVLGMTDLCRRLGARVLNLGGGLGGRDDSLFSFKAGFSKCLKPTATGRFILDQERYTELSAGSDAPEGFFPAYRHGLSG